MLRQAIDRDNRTKVVDFTVLLLEGLRVVDNARTIRRWRLDVPSGGLFKLFLRLGFLELIDAADFTNSLATSLAHAIVL